MLIHRFMITSIFKFMFLMSGISVFAQQEPGQWVGDLYLVDLFSEDTFGKTLIDEKNNIHKKIPSIAERLIDFPIPHKYRSQSYYSYWHNDALYALAYGENEKDEHGSLFTRWTFANWKDDEWHLLGNYKTDTKENLRAIPCDGDRFIVISRNKDLTGDSKLNRSPFHLMSVLSGRKDILLNSSIDHGMDEIRMYMSHPDVFKQGWFSEVIMTDGYATLINYRTGLYWVFSLEKASLVRAGTIFKKVTPEMIANDGFSRAVLCANPEKDGTILISAQDEDYFITETSDAYKEAHDLRKKDPFISNEDVSKILEQRLKEIAEKSPFIVWYRIHPENGRIEKLSVAPEGGVYFRNIDDLKNDTWRPMPDGSIKMGYFEPMLVDNSLKTTDQSDYIDENLAQTRAVQH